jgi:predicted nuclease of predicted toxin-antitoxin system
MRILLDESLPIELRSEIAEHEVRYVREMGWSGLKNGELLSHAAALFDVLVTADQNLEYQQNLNTLPIAVAVLVAHSNRIEQLRPLLPRLIEVLSSLKPCTFVRVEAEA